MNHENAIVAETLREMASLLEQQGANRFRVGAYRLGAETVEALDRSLREILEVEGAAGIRALPHIGPGLTSAIVELLRSGRLSRLERLRGSHADTSIFTLIPGIGPKLAERLADALHVETLEGLEHLAHDGRLEEVDGVGPRRAAAIQAGLAALLRRPRPPHRDPREQPPVSLLLEVDDEYRRQAAARRLPTIAPRRFNPDAKAWLPILHTTRDGWHFTVLFSNTALAHRLGRTRDWVVIYVYDDHHREEQATVVTETRGPLAGLRVVRGRETESAAHYGHGRAGRRPGAGARQAHPDPTV